jgi:hypothetical protein
MCGVQCTVDLLCCTVLWTYLASPAAHARRCATLPLPCSHPYYYFITVLLYGAVVERCAVGLHTTGTVPCGASYTTMV